MPTTPVWEAAKNGSPGDLNSVNHASQVSQFLGSHKATVLYKGAQIVTPSGAPNFTWLSYGTSTDFDQPFTMPVGKTSIGRVSVPVSASGNGADLLVSLYPDNGSGAPNTSSLISATIVPAGYFTNLTSSFGLASGGPLASARFNALYPTGNWVGTGWASSAGNTMGSASFSSSTTSGNFIISVGGSLVTGGPSQSTNSVLTTKFVGAAQVDLSVPQPALPVVLENAGVATTADAVIVVGGNSDNNGVSTILSSVYTASWDPNTGSIGSWSLQTPLPQALWACAATASSNTVYVVGGVTSSNALVNTVYYSTVTNGQTSPWTTVTYPTPLYRPALTVAQGYLIVAGGQTTLGGSTATSAVYYAEINANGSLGPWLSGPPIPLTGGYSTYLTQGSTAATPNALILAGGITPPGSLLDNFLALSIDSSGPADAWYSISLNGGSVLSGGAGHVGAFDVGNGSFGIVYLDFSGQFFFYTTAEPVPMLSVPLPASGLTPGSTYHVVLQQKPSSSASDFLNFGVSQNSLPTAALKSTRHSGSWATALSGFSMPLTVYDNTSSGSPYHTWEDPISVGSPSVNNLASRTTTMVYNRRGLLYGLGSVVSMPNEALNLNPTFSSGVSNWTPHNCTFVQSSSQTQGGFAFSGLMTPNGTALAPNVTSELEPVVSASPLYAPAQYYTFNGWFYSPTGWSNITLSVDWYDASQVYITTSNTTQTIASATWTNIVNTYKPPSNAAFASINVVEAGTPSTSNTLYFSNVFFNRSLELTPILYSLAEVTYDATLLTPTSVDQIA